MIESVTRLDFKGLRRRLRRIWRWHKSGLPERVEHRLRIVGWYGRKRVADVRRFFETAGAGSTDYCIPSSGKA